MALRREGGSGGGGAADYRAMGETSNLQRGRGEEECADRPWAAFDREREMDRRLFAASVVIAAVGIAGAATLAAAPASAAMMTKAQMMKVQQANKARAMRDHLVACYGVNAVGRNDCAAGAHSCAGQATKANDPNSFVLLPQGDCGKLAGGALKPA